VLLPALLLLGSLSDVVGRRPVLLVGLGAACAGLGLFAAARGTAWLFAARVLQGVAVGAVSAVAVALAVVAAATCVSGSCGPTGRAGRTTVSDTSLRRL